MTSPTTARITIERRAGNWRRILVDGAPLLSPSGRAREYSTTHGLQFGIEAARRKLEREEAGV